MKEPTFDRDGYPTDDTLETIKTWPVEDGLPTLFQFIKDALHPMYARYNELCDGTIEIATGGWSGNEDVIAAFQQNVILWSVVWVSSHRGGRFIFRKPKL